MIQSVNNRILKTIKGLGKFSLDDLLMISECEEPEVIECINSLISQKLLSKIGEDKYIFQNKQHPESKRIIKRKNNTLTFSRAADNYINLHASFSCSPSTITSYKAYFKNHLIPHFGKMPLKQITQEDIESFIKRKIDEGISNKSINNFTRLISAVFENAIEQGILVRNPVKKMKKLNLVKNGIRILSKYEIKAILKTAKERHPDFYPLLITALTTGITRGEILGLTWDCIDFKNNQILINKSLYKGKIVKHRIKCQMRCVNISDELCKILLEWQKLCLKGENYFVFPNLEGNAQDPDNMIKRRFNPLIKKSGIREIRFIDLRGS